MLSLWKVICRQGKVKDSFAAMLHRILSEVGTRGSLAVSCDITPMIYHVSGPIHQLNSAHEEINTPQSAKDSCSYKPSFSASLASKKVYDSVMVSTLAIAGSSVNSGSM